MQAVVDLLNNLHPELELNGTEGPSHDAISWRNDNLIDAYEDAGISLEEE